MSNRGRLLESFVLPAGDLVTGSRFMHELKKVRNYLQLSQPEIKAIQDKKLHAVLHHATTKSPYYRSLQIRPAGESHQWLSGFPVLEKEVIRNFSDRMLTRDKKGLVKVSSSGSSGYRTTVFQTVQERSAIRAIQTAFWEKAGFEIGKPVVQTGINPDRTFEKRVKDRLFKTLYVPAFALSEEDAARVFQWIERYPEGEVVFVGYASSLYVMAQMAEKLKAVVRFKSVIALGDKLFDHYRRQIESTFHTQVYETYGASEGLMMGFQADLPFMYVPDFHAIIEILDDDGRPVPDGETGHVVVTSLDHFAMPIIRYRLGDLAAKLPVTAWPTDRALPFSLLKKVTGRDTDIVKTPGGKQIVVHSFTGIFEHLHEISQFCVIQEEIGSIEIEYIPSETFEAGVLEKIKDILAGHIGEPFDIHFRMVDYIQPTASGKPQLIISKLP